MREKFIKKTRFSYLVSPSFPDRQLSIYDDYGLDILQFVACFDPIVVELECSMARIKISDQPRDGVIDMNIRKVSPDETITSACCILCD